MTGWNEGLSATKPVVVGDKLYGRGTKMNFFTNILKIISSL